MLDKLLYDEEVRRCVLTYEQQFHYGVFYAYMKLREQVRTCLSSAPCIKQCCPCSQKMSKKASQETSTEATQGTSARATQASVSRIQERVLSTSTEVCPEKKDESYEDKDPSYLQGVA
eukprot:1148692-Pelagomonas_calceolata.AAC.1